MRGLFDLTGKVVLATGANSGIGLGFLQGCAKHGDGGRSVKAL